jgi:hypothetical protein
MNTAKVSTLLDVLLSPRGPTRDQDQAPPQLRYALHLLAGGAERVLGVGVPVRLVPGSAK